MKFSDYYNVWSVSSITENTGKSRNIVELLQIIKQRTTVEYVRKTLFWFIICNMSNKQNHLFDRVIFFDNFNNDYFECQIIFIGVMFSWSKNDNTCMAIVLRYLRNNKKPSSLSVTVREWKGDRKSNFQFK